MARCGRCRVVTVPDDEAWCVDCRENDNPGDYVAGVHISQIELPDDDVWPPAGGAPGQAPDSTAIRYLAGELDRIAARPAGLDPSSV